MERILVAKLKRREDNRVELFQRGHQWPDLLLHELSDLADVGINYTAIKVGEEYPCRFYANWEASDKLNKAGNPYKDVVLLEPINKPASAASVDTSAILDELRAIRAELARQTAFLAQALGVQDSAPGPEPVGESLLEDEPTADEPPAEGPPPAPQPAPAGVLSDAQAYRKFNRLIGPAIHEGKLTTGQANALAQSGAVNGWHDALDQLLDLVERERVPA